MWIELKEFIDLLLSIGPNYIFPTIIGVIFLVSFVKDDWHADYSPKGVEKRIKELKRKYPY